MTSSSFCIIIIITFSSLTLKARSVPLCRPMLASDADQIKFALNLEFLEAEFFTYGALGKGLDDFAPGLSQGGPSPIGARKANLDPLTNRIIEEFAYQEMGHIRAIVEEVGGIPRPLLNLTGANFARILNDAVGYRLIPEFDPYIDTVNYLLAAYLLPYLGIGGYVGTIPNLLFFKSRSLVGSLLGVESGQDAVIRSLLYQRANEKVAPYDLTVAEVTDRLSNWRNRLGKCGTKDEGISVPLQLGAENRTTSNVLSADANSLSYPRTPQEILRISYASGDESCPDGFFPTAANGNIATSFLPAKI